MALFFCSDFHNLVGLRFPVCTEELLDLGLKHPFVHIAPLWHGKPVELWSGIIRGLGQLPQFAPFAEWNGAPITVKTAYHEWLYAKGRLDDTGANGVVSIRDREAALAALEEARGNVRSELLEWIPSLPSQKQVLQCVQAIITEIDNAFFGGTLRSTVEKRLGHEWFVFISSKVPESFESTTCYTVVDGDGSDTSSASLVTRKAADKLYESILPENSIVILSAVLAFWGDDRDISTGKGGTYVDGWLCLTLLDVLAHLVAHEIAHVLVSLMAKEQQWSDPERRRYVIAKGGHTPVFRALIGNIFGHPWGEEGDGNVDLGCGWLPAEPRDYRDERLEEECTSQWML